MTPVVDLTVEVDAIPPETAVQTHDPESVTHFGHKSSPHRLFCRCKRPVAFINVLVVMPRSLSVLVVIVGIAIALVVVPRQPEPPH
ncbi:MAG: hypothetical protein GY938_27625 [Ketobacter sp.]|nr:hypothetical protein [Ketobacter sp.]